MSPTEQDIDFLTNHHSAAMITVGRDGTPKVSRVGVALVDGQLWSSGTADRVRTGRLRRDPRCTVYVYDPGYAWLALETTVTILDGPDAAELNLRLFRVMQDQPTGALSWFGGALSEEDFLRAMVDERRLIYEFEVHHTYGMH
jgi:PPOX class probable F420-dependent enzyme